QFNNENKQLGTNSAELESLRADITSDENMVKQLGEKWETTKVELQRAPRISLYQEAALQKKDVRRQVMATVAAPLISIVGVCFFVGWWEFRARRIHSADEVVQGLGLRLVGAVPALPGTPDGQFAGAGKDPNLLGHRLVESIDAIRTVLLRDANVAGTRIVMVTSAMNGEGKTTLAGHLAASLARAGRRTLLVDCDLRTPAAHQMLEQSLQPGLSEVLLEEIALANAVRPATAVEGLWLLPAGQWDREVLQALAQDGTQRIFDQLREEFDFIIVDSHPVLEAADSLLVGQHVDAVILSLLQDKSQVPPVQAAAQRLTSLGIRVLGAVVNGVGPEEIYRNGNLYPLQITGR
ncbi:MAG TPA: CpsD/CapB family tyrosine-protein kinase, partial [Gemmataceae bacterium]|nr:CpsD/CapB family tyrosine-protein kinase [Gemmataceae bacterium]